MPNQLLETYTNRQNKHICHNFILTTLLEYYTFTQVVGLGGPDINPYCKKLIDIGIKKFEIWENDQKTAEKQRNEIKYPARMRLGDILQAEPNRVKTLYDLDFTLTVRKMHEHIAKFKENFIMTFSARLKGGADRIIDEFFFVRNETIYSIVDRVKNGISYKSIHTTKGRYMYVPYYDNSPMCCIAKIK